MSDTAAIVFLVGRILFVALFAVFASLGEGTPYVIVPPLIRF